ncbi:HopJ type III effector protein [Flavobacterium sp. N2270]|uniref:HopJ type III effector protein n=1 Tax=Flavobacterium sp. N2270 TaxID=2986831 RepID=UPI0029CABD55|nr:HopJ type III effector protein [Flavobacterium sp. N2270]
MNKLDNVISPNVEMTIKQTNKMTILELINKVKKAEIINFSEVINTIDNAFEFTPTKFKNGDFVNEANTNNGSCKVFSFAKLHQLDATVTLFLFGEHYQKVLQTPNEEDHQNIRNFMKFGWEGIHFEANALSEKK